MKWLLAVVFVIPLTAAAQKRVITGYVKDSNGKPLSRASVNIPTQQAVGISERDGSYKISATPGILSLAVSYTGFYPSVQTFDIKNDTSINFVLTPEIRQLKEVEVTDAKFKQSDLLQTTRMSSITLSKEEVNSIPMLGGEADVLKMIQLLPGVIRGVEGGTDLFVRGGAADQNLVLLDGAPIYNTGHLLGFMSVFNSDILQSVESMTGAFPAEYGGRLSSILDVKTKSGIAQETQVSGNIGLIASRLMIDHPLIKDKLSISLAGRRTYIDKVLQLVHQDVPYHFYDFNGKINYKPTANDNIEFSYYTGKDVLAYTRARRGTDTTRNRNFTSNFIIGNNAQVLRWKKLLHKSWSSDVSLIHTNFNYNISSIFSTNSLYVTSRIEDVGAKWIVSSDSAFRFAFKGGIETTRHQVSPNVINTTGGLSEILPTSSTSAHTMLETSVFAQADYNLTDRWKTSAGLRISSAVVAGRTYVNPEPRVAFRYRINEFTSFKASYSRMAQYLQRVSSSAVAFPTDIWFPVTKTVLPQLSNQVSVGLQHNFVKQHVYLSVESYYKQMDHLIGYQEGTNLFLNTNFEEKLIQGKGRSYGIEVLLKKEAGNLSGWISCTLSKSERQYDQINGGDWFLARYDRRHNGAVVASYKLSTKFSVSAVWEFISGSRFTPIVGQYVVPSPTLSGLDLVPVYAKINSVKLADTHRLDLGIKYRPRSDRRFKSEWFAGIYNVYNRASPIGINIVSDGNGGYRYQQPGLFGLLPFISYGFKF